MSGIPTTEQRFPKPEVGGSNPLGDAIFSSIYAIFRMTAD
jgi:hypothetical protein